MDISQSELNRLVEQGFMSIETLAQIGKVEENDIKKFLAGEENMLSFEERGRLAHISAMLHEGMELIEDDERVQGIIDVLKDIYKIDNRAIAHYIDVDEQTLSNFMVNPDSISYEIRYKIGVRVSMLHYVFK